MPDNLNEGFDRAQFRHDNQSPPEGPRCRDCGEFLDEDDDDCEGLCTACYFDEEEDDA